MTSYGSTLLNVEELKFITEDYHVTEIRTGVFPLRCFTATLTLSLKVGKVGHNLPPHHSYFAFHPMSEVWVLCSIFKLQNKAEYRVCVSVSSDELAV